MKFSRKQLNQVKRSYKDSFSDEDSNNSPSKLLRKKALKQIKEDYKKINDIKNTNNESKAKLRKERLKKNVDISWNFDVGDAVEYKMYNESTVEVGIVLEIIDQSFRNMKDALKYSTVELLTPSGRIHVPTRNVVKIEDE
tara:strand:+ start:53 stop:472 length:420 start_codon:yes stop_codon:yes gene_type:complete